MMIFSNQAMYRSINTVTTSCLVALLYSTSLSAQSIQTSIKVNPLHGKRINQTVQSSVVKTSSSDPRLKQIADFLKNNKQPASANQTTKTANANHTNQPTLPVTSTVSVLLTESSTPRQIKALRQVLMKRATGSASANTNVALATARQYLDASSHLLRLDNPEKEMVLKSAQTDYFGKQHLRFHQTYHNLEVWKSALTVHINEDGDVELVDGMFYPSPKKLSTTPIYTATQATETAHASIPQGIITTEINPPRLVIYPEHGKQPRLAWEVTLSASLNHQWLILVDAHTGKQILAYNQVKDAATTASAEDVFGNQQQLNIYQADNQFFMADTSKPMFQGGSPFPVTSNTGAIYILDDKNQATITKDGDVEFPDRVALASSLTRNRWPRDAVSAAFTLSATYDYYSQVHSRNSLDGNGGSILAVVRVGKNYANAFWNGQVIGFGDAIPFAGALDVVGHELTHGVIDNSSNLIYRNQPGALNEALADIFGEAIEAHTFGQADWLSGNQLGFTIRNFRNPGALTSSAGVPYPASMSEFVNLPTTPESDQGGIHINSTIITHAFYLLAEGLNGAIGINDAEQIFYRAMVFHLVPRSRFLDARLAVIQSAKEIYGENSVQAQKAAEAFDAVEIFDAATIPDTNNTPPINGPDATVFIERDPGDGLYILKRRDPSLNDPQSGITLTALSVSPKRPSVDRDKGLAVFINSNHEVCLINLTTHREDCLNPDIQVHSIAVSADGKKFALIFLDSSGLPDNKIGIIDITNDQQQLIDLVAPATEGASTTTIVNADAMDFTNDDRFLVYDAFNEITVADGSQIGVWSIYALDLANETTFALVPPVNGFHFAFPSLSQTSDDFLTFDALNLKTGVNTVTAASLVTGEIRSIHTSGDFGTPSYTGDDTGIVFSQSDSTSTGFSLFKQPLQADRISPTGTTELWLKNADYGVIYRRNNTITAPPQNQQPVVKEGLWLIPDKPGSGFDIQVTSNNDLFMTWYTYTLNETPIWYLASGPLNGNTWHADIFEYTWDGSTAIPSRSGNARLTFQDTTHASLTWTLNTGNGTADIEYFTFAQGDTTSSGTWYEPARPGYGLTHIQQGATQVNVLYFYDQAGNPRWVLGSAPATASTTSMDSYRGTCPVCPFERSIASSSGTVTASFTNQLRGTLSTDIVLPSPLLGSWRIFDATIANLSE